MNYAEKILNIINASCNHLTAEQVFFEIKKTEPKIVLATVYNNLNLLYQKQLIQKVVIEGQADRYDKIEKHDHLICQSCGKLLDFKFTDLTQELNQQLHSNVFKYDLKVYYECPECKERREKNEFKSNV